MQVHLSDKRCLACEGEADKLDHNKASNLLGELNKWKIVEDKHIEKTLQFKDFASALDFVNKVGQIAEQEKHHPDINLFNWNKVKLILTTHALDGLSENDFILAAKIDELKRKE